MANWKVELRTLAIDFGIDMVMVKNLIHEAEKTVKSGTHGRTIEQTRYDYVCCRLKKYIMNV